VVAGTPRRPLGLTLGAVGGQRELVAQSRRHQRYDRVVELRRTEAAHAERLLVEPRRPLEVADLQIDVPHPQESHHA
jgi:hypothetical protein